MYAYLNNTILFIQSNKDAVLHSMNNRCWQLPWEGSRELRTDSVVPKLTTFPPSTTVGSNFFWKGWYPNTQAHEDTWFPEYERDGERRPTVVLRREEIRALKNWFKGTVPSECYERLVEETNVGSMALLLYSFIYPWCQFLLLHKYMWIENLGSCCFPKHWCSRRLRLK